jgi:hypothetical protein
MKFANARKFDRKSGASLGEHGATVQGDGSRCLLKRFIRDGGLLPDQSASRHAPG